MKYTNVSICSILALAILFACTSTPFEGSESISSSHKPKHHTSDGYQNYPFVETAAPKGFFFYIRRVWSSVFVPDIPDGHTLPEQESIELLNSIKSDSITWLGHASFLIRVANKTILTDPFLSKYASPVSWAGPTKLVASPLRINTLPSIDIVIVSHNHYDHLDDETVSNLKTKMIFI